MKFIARLMLVVALVLMAGPLAAAADRVVKGTVLDNQDEPLVGVSVVVAGQKRGISTDIDGNFSLKVPAGPVTLQFSYVGYNPKDVKVDANQSEVKVLMTESSIALNETVVIGYGVQKKVNLTGAVASVNGEQLEGRGATTVSNMLQGSVAGLNVTTSSGVPGQSATINIRGRESLSGNNGPLILIDGAIGNMDLVNPNDIESVSVIKDASAAAVYGARAAFGVILVTTKSGQSKEGKSTVRYNGRIGWDEGTTPTDFINKGYWHAYVLNVFQQGENGTNLIEYDNEDMMELLARINDTTESPDRPWIVTKQNAAGRENWRYYANMDWYHTLFQESRPVQQHNVSISGGKDKYRYFVSGGLEYRDGIMKINTDKYKRYNMRAKLDFAINKYATFSSNTAFYGSTYNWVGYGAVDNNFAMLGRHLYSFFPWTNPDGSYVIRTPEIVGSYSVGNARHIIMKEGNDRNVERKTNFTNTSRITITPIKQLSIVGDFSYRFYQNRTTNRSTCITYRDYPGEPLKYYGSWLPVEGTNTGSGAGENSMTERVNTHHYYSVNAFATYKETFNKDHNLTVMAGYNYEQYTLRKVGAKAWNLANDYIDDFNTVVNNKDGIIEMEPSGGQGEYKLQGVFGRINYDYMGKYLLELSGRYDGSSRFAKGHRWGFFPSASLGWRISEEKFMAPTRSWLDNAKIRVSYGSLGNQNVSDYYTWLRQIETKSFASYTFGAETPGSYTSLQDPKASDLTWEKTNQWDVGLDLFLFNNRLNFTGDFYIRDTKDMLTTAMQLPDIYGAGAIKANAADMRTKGYELAVSWNDQFLLFGKPFIWSVGFNISDYDSKITKFKDNESCILSSNYEGKNIGDIWGYSTDGFFKTTEEAQEYAKNVDLTKVTNTLVYGHQAGDLKFLDTNGDGKVNDGDPTMISDGKTFLVEGDEGYAEAKAKVDANGNPVFTSVPINSLYNHGDLKKLGNSLASLQYGFTAKIQYFGFDASVFFQGTGNHYWYPNNRTTAFWGPYGYCKYASFIPQDFMDDVWTVDNPNTYFPRPASKLRSNGYLQNYNDRYIQNIRYLRFKNLTVGYTIPTNLTRRVGIDRVRVYFTGENLYYWSPLKKHSKYVDPEAAFNRDDDANGGFYPWPKTYMFGLDVTF